MLKRIMTVFLIFCIFLIGRAYAQTSFAILPTESRGGIGPEVIEEVQSGLNRILIESKRYTIVDRQRVRDVLKEQAFQVSGVTDQNNIVKLGKIFNVEKFVQTTLYRKTGNQLVLRCGVIDVSTAKIEVFREFSMGQPWEIMGRYCAGEIIASYPLIGKVEAFLQNAPVINLGQHHGIKKGDRLFAARKQTVRGEDGKVLLSETIRVGTLEVVSPGEVGSRTRVMQLSEPGVPIARGDIISPSPIPRIEPKASSVPLLAGIKKGELLFEDEMRGSQYLSVKGNNGAAEYKSGKLRLFSPFGSRYLSSAFYTTPFDQLQDFILEGEMEFDRVEPKGSNSFKIYFRAGYPRGGGQYWGYALYLAADGTYGVSVDGNERNEWIVPMLSAAFLNRGEAKNRFRIAAVDSKVDIYINDRHAASFEDETHSRGTVGLLARAGTAVSISRIAVWKVEKTK